MRYQLLSGFDERYMVRCLAGMTLRPCYLLADAPHGVCREQDKTSHCYSFRPSAHMATEPSALPADRAPFMRRMWCNGYPLWSAAVTDTSSIECLDGESLSLPTPEPEAASRVVLMVFRI